MKPVEIVLLGAGSRGTFSFGRYALHNPHQVRFVAVAEPIDERRERFAAEHDIPAERQFRTWEELLAQPQLAPALLNTTMDRMHVPSTLAALRVGYDVLLEKPMATSAKECVALVLAAEREGRVLQICHVLRYTLFWRALHRIVNSGRLGDVVTVEHRENVAYWHMAHSFVRGNWGNSAASAPMILAKCCHDMDILYWVLGSPVRRMTAVGALTHFAPESAPDGAPDRCTDGCPAQNDCPFFAPRLYLREDTSWPVNVISVDPSMEARLEALRHGPYGRCVYRCDNDVPDHHLVQMELESGVTVAFAMQGHSHDNVRTMRYDGARATLRASEAAHELTVYDHLTGNEETLRPGTGVGGHGGGDAGVMGAFVRTMRGEDTEPMTSARASLESHLMSFAAEEARTSGRIVDMAAFRAQAQAQALNGSLGL